MAREEEVASSPSTKEALPGAADGSLEPCLNTSSRCTPQKGSKLIEFRPLRMCLSGMGRQGPARTWVRRNCSGLVTKNLILSYG